MGFFARPWMLLVVPPAGAALWWAERTLLEGRAAGSRSARAARIAMRSGLVILLALAAAGLRLGGEAVRPACVFALDVSRSMGSLSTVEQAYFRARSSLPAGTPRAVCGFAGRGRVLTGFAETESEGFEALLDGARSDLSPLRTNIADGLRTALGALPAQVPGAVVLVSDGRETEGRALEAAMECRARGVPLFALVPDSSRAVDVRVETLTVPSSVELGRPVPIVATVSSSRSLEAEVTLEPLAGGGTPKRVRVRLHAESPARVAFQDVPGRGGVVRYEVKASPAGGTAHGDSPLDDWPENDRALAAVRVLGTPRVLVVTRGGGTATLLRGADRESGERFEVESVPPSRLPASAEALRAYLAVTMEGLARKDLSAAQEDAVCRYVRSGGGLLVTGGPSGFGAGGWRDSDPLSQVLPVMMSPGPLERLLVVLMVDASGSMKKGAAGGRTKMELAREAVAAVLPELGPDDQVALVAFRDRAELLLGPVSAGVRDEVLDSVRDLEADGPTSLTAPLAKGLEVAGASGAEKRVAILLSDGEPTVEFSRERLLDLAGRFRGEDSSLHVLGTNPSDEHRRLLDSIAARGGGTVEHQSDYSRVKDALRNLFERATNRYVRTGPVPVVRGGAPADVLDGLGECPPLGAVNRTQMQPTGQAVLVTATGEPVLALGRAGAGRAAVFTSALEESWAGAFAGWRGRLRLFSQVLRQLMAGHDEKGLTARAVREAGDLFVEMEATDESGRPRNLLDLGVLVEPAASSGAARSGRQHGPDGAARLLKARQVGLGRYRAKLPPSTASAAWGSADWAAPVLHVIELRGDGSEREIATQPLILPAPLELVRTGADRASLDEIARASGGRVLAGPGEMAAALDGLKSRASREASWLLALAALALVTVELVARLLAGGGRRATSRRDGALRDG